MAKILYIPEWAADKIDQHGDCDPIKNSLSTILSQDDVNNYYVEQWQLFKHLLGDAFTQELAFHYMPQFFVHVNDTNTECLLQYRKYAERAMLWSNLVCDADAPEKVKLDIWMSSDYTTVYLMPRHVAKTPRVNANSVGVNRQEIIEGIMSVLHNTANVSDTSDKSTAFRRNSVLTGLYLRTVQ